MTKFKYETMMRKYNGFVSLLPDYKHTNTVDMNLIRDNFPKVTVRWQLARDVERTDIKDWCQEQFDDRWTYDYDDFYFHNQKDANWFALKWS